MLSETVNPNPAIMLSVKESARRLGVSQALVYALCSRGEIEHHRFGVGRGAIRIEEGALQKYLCRAKVAGKHPQRPEQPTTFHHLNATRLAAAWAKPAAS
jgi:excisionase family DNA binding protein